MRDIGVSSRATEAGNHAEVFFGTTVSHAAITRMIWALSHLLCGLPDETNCILKEFHGLLKIFALPNPAFVAFIKTPFCMQVASPGRQAGRVER